MNELVKVENQQVVTTSRNVAEHFEKEHRNVTAAIKGLLKNKHTQEMFFETTYVNEQNGQTYPMYLNPKDFMTYTGLTEHDIRGIAGKEGIACE